MRALTRVYFVVDVLRIFGTEIYHNVTKVPPLEGRQFRTYRAVQYRIVSLQKVSLVILV
jgi:hypothetical protein